MHYLHVHPKPHCRFRTEMAFRDKPRMPNVLRMLGAGKRTIEADAGLHDIRRSPKVYDTLHLLCIYYLYRQARS